MLWGLVAIAFAIRPKISRNAVAAVVLLFGLGIIGAGIVSAAAGLEFRMSRFISRQVASSL